MKRTVHTRPVQALVMHTRGSVVAEKLHDDVNQQWCRV